MKTPEHYEAAGARQSSAKSETLAIAAAIQEQTRAMVAIHNAKEKARARRQGVSFMVNEEDYREVTRHVANDA